MQLFNIYYINYDKAFELSMLIDNHLKDNHSITEENKSSIKVGGSVDTEKVNKIPLLDKIIPQAKIELDSEGSKVKNVVDNFKVVSTKSTVLSTIYEKSSEIRKLTDSKIGMLVKIRNTKLTIDNAPDILATKSLLSGVLKDVPVEGTNGMDLTQFCEVFLKDSAYIFNGNFGKEKIAFKIPMKLESEMESQYSISDLEIGPMTVLGIYRGEYKINELNIKISRLKDLENRSIQQTQSNMIESDEDMEEIDNKDTQEKVHFIDVIAVIQELSIK
ncbi:hypothetical protein ACXAT3_002647 [Clostridium sporogenes]